MTPPLTFRVRLGSLRPADADAEDALRAMGEGADCTVTFKRTTRSSARMRFYRAMLHAAAGVLAQQVLGLRGDDLHQRMKDDMGLYDELVTPGGVAIRRYRSTAYGKMTEPDFAAYVDRVDAKLSRWLDVPPGSVIDEARARMGEVA